MGINQNHQRVARIALHCGLIAALLFAQVPLVACPEETVTYPPVAARQFVGRIEPPTGQELLPTEIEFLIREKGKEKFEREVPVQSDGTFAVGFPEGSYEFKIKAEGFLFTVVGVVNITLEANENEKISLPLPWC